MASWDPQVSDVTGHVPGWEHAVVEDDVLGHIFDAGTEIIGEVGWFDPDHVINPRASQDQQRTLGDLAQQAAEYRAADLWVSGLAPEMFESIDPIRVQLYASYTRLLASLKRHVRRSQGRRGVLGSVRLQA